MNGANDDWTPWRNDEFRIRELLDTDILDVGALDGTLLPEVLDYWEKQRGSDFAPPLSKVRLDDLSPAIIPCMVIVDFVGEPMDRYYRFVGTQMVDIFGTDLTGKRNLDERIEGYGFVSAGMFPEMIERRRPIVSGTKWISVKSVMYQTLSVHLPLSDDGQTISHGVTANQFIQLK